MIPQDKDGLNLEQYYKIIDEIVSHQDILIFKNLSFFGIDGYADLDDENEARSLTIEEIKNNIY